MQMNHINIPLLANALMVYFARDCTIALLFMSLLLLLNKESISLWFWWNLPITEACVMSVYKHTAISGGIKYHNYSKTDPY